MSTLAPLILYTCMAASGAKELSDRPCRALTEEQNMAVQIILSNRYDPRPPVSDGSSWQPLGNGHGVWVRAGTAVPLHCLYVHHYHYHCGRR